MSIAAGTALFATCPKGLEYLLVDELTRLGADNVHEALAGVHFQGDATVAYRVCLWSRLASRVLLPIASFEAADEAALYAGAGAVDWSRHLDIESTLAVDATLVQSQITHARFAEQRVKDAVVDALRDAAGKRPSVDTARPDVRINLLLRRDQAQLAIDLSGEALHRRGWRVAQGGAPMKENLACALLLRAGWPETYAAGGALVDPMCGSGTLLIEGARMAADVAPGLSREYFGLFGWRGFDSAIWIALTGEARRRAETGLRSLRACFFGADADAEAIASSKRNAQQAGVAGFVNLQKQGIEHLHRPAEAESGLLVCNPPYDERLAADATLYRELGALLRREFVGWQAGIIVADDALGRALGLRIGKRYMLYNGAIRCQLLRIEHITPDSEGKAAPTRELSAGGEMVANRLRRNQRRLKPWLTREQVGCYRAYDADLPEYAAAIDVYRAVADDRLWLHVQEYRAPAEIPEETTRERLADLIHAAMSVFEVPRERVALKTRAPQTRNRRYQQQDVRGETFEVDEDGLRFRVNLFDYLDTGLFLDHRPTRRMLRANADDARFLNLFCYTGAATVHAAAGGARTTTSVDLSATYLQWATDNLAANGYAGSRHRLVQADALRWLEADDGARFDLIFCDPPTFSNSARAADFDIQRDHGRLLRAAMARLEADGLLVFSNNFRRFRLDADLAEDFSVEEVGDSALPPDFERNPRIHKVYLFRHRGDEPQSGDQPQDARRLRRGHRSG